MLEILFSNLRTSDEYATYIFFQVTGMEVLKQTYKTLHATTFISYNLKIIRLTIDNYKITCVIIDFSCSNWKK